MKNHFLQVSVSNILLIGLSFFLLGSISPSQVKVEQKKAPLSEIPKIPHDIVDIIDRGESGAVQIDLTTKEIIVKTEITGALRFRLYKDFSIVERGQIVYLRTPYKTSFEELALYWITLYRDDWTQTAVFQVIKGKVHILPLAK